MKPKVTRRDFLNGMAIPIIKGFIIKPFFVPSHLSAWATKSLLDSLIQI
jgi:hypothetical protein